VGLRNRSCKTEMHENHQTPSQVRDANSKTIRYNGRRKTNTRSDDETPLRGERDDAEE
jgi:hypothetical protein